MNGTWLVSYGVLWVVVLTLLCIVVVLARQVGVLHMRIGPVGARVASVGPEIGGLAPEIETVDFEGNLIKLGGNQDRRTLLLFMSPQCSSCAGVAPSIRALARSERSTLRVALVSLVEDVDKVGKFLHQNNLQNVPCVLSNHASKEYGISALPYAVVIDKSGRTTAKGIVNHMEHLESLLNVAEIEGGERMLERSASST